MMAIGTTYDFDLTAEDFVRRAFQIAGVFGPRETPDAHEFGMARDFADMILKSWQCNGRAMRLISRNTYTLTSGTATVPGIDADTIDIEFPAFVTDSNGTDHRVERMSLDEYQVLSNKTQTGIPARAYVERSSAISMTLYPTPSASATSITVVRRRLIKDFEAGTNPEIFQRHLAAACRALAVDLAEAFGKSDQKIMRLENRAMRNKRDVDVDNRERGGFRWRLGG